MGFLLTWRHGVSTSTGEDGTYLVRGPGGQVTFQRLAPQVLSAFERLDPPGEDEDQLVATVAEPDHLAHWYYYLDRLTRRGLLCHTAHDGGTPLATLVATSPSFTPLPARLVPDRHYVLSRFAYLRRDGGTPILESPLAHARVVLNDCRVAALIAGLSGPCMAESLGRAVGLSEVTASCVLTLLLRTGMVLEVGPDGACAEEGDAALQTWAFHDLLFHARSRRGRTDAPYGGTYRFVDRLPAPPALRPAPSGEAYPLFRPDLAHLERYDRPLTWVQERRRSIRAFDAARPIAARQLGEFLFRAARVADRRDAEVPTARGPIRMEMTTRPYPAGGSLYEQELYVAVNACEGLAAGLYYYDPAEHRLIRVRAKTPAVEGLLQEAGESTAIPSEELQILFVLAARVPRVAWKYESIAYALVLKHVGVMYEVMYLVATAMGLAPCAVGGGDTELFARAAGVDYAAETSVGEFLLGSRRNDPGEATRETGWPGPSQRR